MYNLKPNSRSIKHKKKKQQQKTITKPLTNDVEARALYYHICC